MDPITIAALLGAGATILSGFLGSSAAQQASSTQAAAADKAINLQAATIAQARADAAPWLAAGNNALQQLTGELGLSNTVTPQTVGANGKITTGATVPFQSQFQTTPGYQFQVDEGTKGVNNSLAAQGLTGSGAALKALTRFRTGLADQTYNQYLDRLSGLSTGGQTTEGNTSNQALSSANSQSQLLQNQGAATASGYVGSTNALTSGLTGAASGLTNALGFDAYIKSQSAGGGGW